MARSMRDFPVFLATLTAMGVVLVLAQPATAQPGEIAFEVADSSANSSDGEATIHLTRSGGSSGVVTARIRIATGGSAEAGTHFVSVPGLLANGFDVGTGPNNDVEAIALQPDGKILIAGNFTQVNGQPRGRIARLNPDGSLDPSFTTANGASARIEDLMVLPNGQIIIAGRFLGYNGTPSARVALLNDDGSLDNNFNSAVEGTSTLVYSIARQADGKFVIGGLFSTVGGASRSNIARLNANGSNDATFNPGTGANQGVRKVLVQANQQIVAIGVFTSFNDVNCGRVVRLHDNGAIDTPFLTGVGANNHCHSGLLLPDQRILVSGLVSTYSGHSSQRVVRLEPNGTADTGFVCGGFGSLHYPTSFAQQPDDRLLVAGNFQVAAGQPRLRIARLETNGALDVGFIADASSSVNALVLDDDGSILVGGLFATINGEDAPRVARLRGDWLVSWDDGDSAAKTITLPLLSEGSGTPQTVEFELYHPTGVATIGATAGHTLTIHDDGAPNNGGGNGNGNGNGSTNNGGGCASAVEHTGWWPWLLVALVLATSLLRRRRWATAANRATSSGN